MSRSPKDKNKRIRKPIIALVCEGRNKTETNFFNHFNKRDNAFILKIIPSESTDPQNMIKKAKQKIQELELDNKIGDRMFCLIDIDLSKNHCDIVQKEKQSKCNKKCKVEFILSNPCFEIWFLYYFTQYPKIENSSKNVKVQLKQYVPEYNENFDIYEKYNLKEKHSIAINHSTLRQQLDEKRDLIDRNPYTEVPDLLEIILNFKKIIP